MEAAVGTVLVGRDANFSAQCSSRQRSATARKHPVLPVCAQGCSLCAQGHSPLARARPSTPHTRILGGYVTSEEALRWRSILALATARLCAPSWPPVSSTGRARSTCCYQNAWGAQSSSPASSSAPLDVLRPPCWSEGVCSARPVCREDWGATTCGRARSLHDCVAAA
ncbi:hypothetical protein B0H14DRAFT_2867451, partial [Mycena olivaceomarginata]